MLPDTQNLADLSEQVDALKRDLEKKTTAIGNRVVAKVDSVEALVTAAIRRIDTIEHRITGSSASLGTQIGTVERTLNGLAINHHQQMTTERASGLAAHWQAGLAAEGAYTLPSDDVVSRMSENMDLLNNKMERLLAKMAPIEPLQATPDSFQPTQQQTPLPPLMRQAPRPRRQQCIAPLAFNDEDDPPHLSHFPVLTALGEPTAALGSKVQNPASA